MAERRNHHYVPQFFFRRFSQDGKRICCVLRKGGKYIPDASIKGQACKAWFYGNAEIEDALSKIEGGCSHALRALSACSNPALLPPDDVELLLIHIMLQRSRTQSARDMGRAHQNKLLQLHLEMQLARDSCISEAERAELQELLPDIEMDPVKAQGFEMIIALENTNAIRDLMPIILRNKTVRPFIFGDAPVVFYNPYCRDVVLRGVLGFRAQGLLVIMPLDSWNCLILVDAEVYKIRGGRNNQISVRSLSDVASLNKLQICAATNGIYFEEPKYSNYVISLLEQERNNLTKHEGRVVTAPGFDATANAYIGDIVHSFQPQLSYRPLFTFLQHPVLSDNDSRRLYRAGAADDSHIFRDPMGVAGRV